MQYHPDDFLALADAVEGEGGFVQPDPCVGELVRLKIGGAWKRFQTAHCDMQARLAIPYDPTEPVNLEVYEVVKDKDGLLVEMADGEYKRRKAKVLHEGEPDKGAAFAAVCAVDDAVGLWPRYAGIVSDASYEE